jgi:alpha-glucosidase
LEAKKLRKGSHMDFIWWRDGVVYQIYPRSFQDTTGSGIGDLQGIIQRLDHLANLGVDALWISPIYPSPMKDFGYDVSDYTAIHQMFGTMADFDQLVEAAHARGLKIVLDYVPSHSSDQHPWFIESRSSRDNPKRGWYFWRDGEDGNPPNNWLAYFGGSQWEWDEATGQYYLHSFLKEQPDLNWFNPDVEAALLDVIRFWLDKGVDGLRMDVIMCTLKHPDLPDNPLAASTIGKPMGDYDSQQHIHDQNYPADRQHRVSSIRQIFDSYDDRAVIGETYLSNPDDLAPWYGENMDGLHLPFNFTLMHQPFRAETYRAAIQRYYDALPDGAQPNFVLGSHDEHRIASRFGPQNARSAALILLTLRGTPTIYYGDEIGMQDVDIPPEKEQDPFGLRVPGLGLGRDPARTPMQWDASHNAGFAPDAEEAWLPLADDYETVNVAAQVNDPTSTLSFYRELLRLRRSVRTLRRGSLAWVDDLPQDVLGYTRTFDTDHLLVLVNFGGAAQSVPLPADFAEGGVLISTRMNDTVHTDAGRIALEPYEGVLIK